MSLSACRSQLSTEHIGDTQIPEAWANTHFTIPSDMLLKENMIGQMWRDFILTQRQLSTCLMDTCRVQSSTAPKTKAFVIASKQGEPMTTQDFVADEIGSCMEAHS